MILSEIARVIRSKNAGPFLVTFDIIFPDEETLDRVRRSDTLTSQTVARLYGVSANEILDFAYYPMARAVKFSMYRPHPSGARFDTDVYGAQQHAPLLALPVSMVS
ncbi:MAG: DUF4387 domain-containing protein [Methylobacterium sp.]|nr:DUF4387 domain-containing protein [Methylobacterium sp.]